MVFNKNDVSRLKVGIKTWLRSNTCDSQIDEAMGILSKLNRVERHIEKVEAKHVEPVEA